MLLFYFDFLRIVKRGDPSDLRPQDDSERRIDKYYRKDNLVCHSERSEESLTFIEFLKEEILRLTASG
jgi:hypothetical protein